MLVMQPMMTLLYEPKITSSCVVVELYRIMSLTTCNKNIDIILHYCIISHIISWFLKKRSALTNIRKDALKYMIHRLWYGIVHITCHISPRAFGPWAIMVVSGWYDV
jgi:hypothetical protein